jgi:cytochrome c553
MADFKTGARKDPTRMNSIATEVTEEEARQAAQWFAALPTPRLHKGGRDRHGAEDLSRPGRMRFAEPDGSREPIGNRIIPCPEDQTRATAARPAFRFVAYVPLGSIARGRIAGRRTAVLGTIACGVCHGPSMLGTGEKCRASQARIRSTRASACTDSKTARANGPDAALMKPIVAQLTDEDIVAIAAYLGSLAP